MRWAGPVAHMGERRDVYRVFVWKTEGRDHLGYPGVEVKIVLRWIFMKWDVGDMEWIELAQDRDRGQALVNAVMNLRVP